MSLHGTSSTADRQARLSGLERLTQTASAVVVFPEAIQPIRTGYEWDPGRDVDCEVTLHEAVRGGFPVVLCCEKST